MRLTNVTVGLFVDIIVLIPLESYTYVALLACVMFRLLWQQSLTCQKNVVDLPVRWSNHVLCGVKSIPGCCESLFFYGMVTFYAIKMREICKSVMGALNF